MDHTSNKFTGQAATVISLATIALLPLFLLPTTPNFFETNKLMLLIGSSSLLLIVWAIDTLMSKRFRLELLPFSLPLIGFGLMHFASSFIMTPKSPVEALMNRGSFFIALAVFVSLTASLVNQRKYIRQAINTLIGSGTVLAVATIFQSFGFGLSNLINQFAGTNLPNTLAFTPAGSPVALMTFLAPVMLLSLFLAFTKTEAAEKVSLFVLSSIMAAAFMVVAVYSFPGKETSPIFLPFQTGYVIAIETLKNPKTALLGVGTNSFGVAYNQLRPAFMNSTELWNVRFGVSTNELLQTLTTVGLIGIALFGWLVRNMFKTAKLDIRSNQIKALKIVSFGLLLLFFVVPGSYVMYFVFAVALLLWGLQVKFARPETITVLDKKFNWNEDSPITVTQRVGSNTFVTVSFWLLPSLLASGVALYSLVTFGSWYRGEMTYKKAIDAANANDGVKTYDLQRQAILENPFLARYRRSYATTNLALANALAGNKELTDQDKQNIAQLIQQAIREAKIAVSLEPENVANWESLSIIYRSLINAAEGADQWTVAALSQAIQTDPVNPALRVDLGGVYYSLGAYDQAIRLFQQAVELKPDMANAYYNLSHAYNQKKDVVSAFDYMKQTLSLTPADSADYTKAKEELEALSKLLPKQEQPQGQQAASETAPAKTNLQTASPAPSPATTVNLPAGSGPENADNVAPTTPSTDVQPQQ